MARSSSVRKIVIAGALAAVSIVLGFTPLGYIPWFSGATLSVLAVPTIIGAVLEGPVVGIVVGGVFGATSLVQAATNPARGPIDVFFVNPFISVLPRLLIGLAAWLVYRLFRGKLVPAAAATAGVVGSLANSVFVLGALVLAGAIPLAVAATVLVANGLLEAAAAGILSSAVVSAWRGIASRSGKSRLADEGR
jgi:uncharacterized membrane protein